LDSQNGKGRILNFLLISKLLEVLDTEHLEEIQDECCKAHGEKRIQTSFHEDDNFKRIADLAIQPLQVYHGPPLKALDEYIPDNYEAYIPLQGKLESTFSRRILK